MVCLPLRKTRRPEKARMSSLASQNDRQRGQQTLHEVVNSRRIEDLLTGIHARVELPDPDFEARLANNRNYEYVVINFSDAEEVIECDGSLAEVLEPWHIPVIVATEDDEILDTRTFQDVLNLLEVVAPAIYVPDIVYNYEQMDETDQLQAIEAYLYHVRSLQNVILKQNLAIRLLPTNKGWTVDHFEKYRALYEECGYTELAFYCVQYSGGNAGNATRQLRRHVSNAIAALDLHNVFLIGRLARDELLRFPPEVQGACGLRRIQSADSFSDLKRRHEQALFANSDQTQSYLTKQK